jgi:hypothetical protein
MRIWLAGSVYVRRRPRLLPTHWTIKIYKPTPSSLTSPHNSSYTPSDRKAKITSDVVHIHSYEPFGFSVGK